MCARIRFLMHILVFISVIGILSYQTVKDIYTSIPNQLPICRALDDQEKALAEVGPSHADAHKALLNRDAAFLNHCQGLQKKHPEDENLASFCALIGDPENSRAAELYAEGVNNLITTASNVSTKLHQNGVRNDCSFYEYRHTLYLWYVRAVLFVLLQPILPVFALALLYSNTFVVLVIAILAVSSVIQLCRAFDIERNPLMLVINPPDNAPYSRFSIALTVCIVAEKLLELHPYMVIVTVVLFVFYFRAMQP
jgi:hypothetical protein